MDRLSRAGFDVVLNVGFGRAFPSDLAFSFGTAVPGGSGGVVVACPRLAGSDMPEVWRLGEGLASVRVDVQEADGDIAAATAEAYRRLLAQVRTSPHPYVVRVWNYLDAINRGAGDAERYRRFCQGRADAIDPPFNAPPPAATAIGHPIPTGAVQVVALCSSQPARALENPRQTPAWRYPRDYGPVAPGFSRGVLLGEGRQARLLASGTASIVGHHSMHAGDARAQLRESVCNLDALAAEAERVGGPRFAMQQPEALRVYLRDPSDLADVQAEAEAVFPPERVVYLYGDICRRDLKVELEGVFAPR